MRNAKTHTLSPHVWDWAVVLRRDQCVNYERITTWADIFNGTSPLFFFGWVYTSQDINRVDAHISVIRLSNIIRYLFDIIRSLCWILELFSSHSSWYIVICHGDFNASTIKITLKYAISVLISLFGFFSSWSVRLRVSRFYLTLNVARSTRRFVRSNSRTESDFTIDPVAIPWMQIRIRRFLGIDSHDLEHYNNGRNCLKKRSRAPSNGITCKLPVVRFRRETRDSSIGYSSTPHRSVYFARA